MKDGDLGTIEPAEVATDGERQLLHSALEDFGGKPLDEVALRDRERLAVVLQAAALLAHLEIAGLRLTGGWDEARVTGDGLLKVPGVRRGRAKDLPQTLLCHLLTCLFRTEGEEIKGRGEGRRIARHLCSRWQQTLVPSSGDREVAEILETADFLWQPPFAPARTALAAEHRVGSRRWLWLAGPGAARRRVLAAARDRPQAETLLRGAGARDLWEGWDPRLDPRRLAEQGRWHLAVAAWRRQPPHDPDDLLACAQALFALGKYSSACRVLNRQMSFEARKLRLWCQLLLGQRNAARETVRRLVKQGLTGEQTVALAESAIRLHADLGQQEKIREWIGRALAGNAGAARPQASIAAAFAAWDLRDGEAMDRHLEGGRAALGMPELAWKWYHARSLRSLMANDPVGAVGHLEKAFQLGRRRLLPGEAGRLWNDVAVARARADDLPGAERACLHSFRLLSACEGPSAITLAQYNLAELRLRRGRAASVESTLEISTTENRRNGNLRGLIHDLELWVRLELVQGRALAALARCAEAERQADGRDFGERRAVFEVFAARAHGWLRRPAEASALLERATGGRVAAPVLGELEIEERPAVWALAGRLEEALREAAGTPWVELWAALAAGTLPKTETWQNLRALEPFRAARLVFDCELIRSGTVPPSWVRQAITTLRRTGAEPFAQRLENQSLSPWRAVERYLTRPGIDAGAAAELLAAAGYGGARLSWTADGRETEVIAGEGGSEKLSAVADGGCWVLRAPTADRVLGALFALIRRDLEPPRSSRREQRDRSLAEGIVGHSVALRKALDRVDQLAPGELPILLLGESGTGKELFARHVHRSSRRSSRSFLAVNCAAFSETLTPSDLFGHVKGSFTGADRDRSGVFETARGGTVFLDEIGDLPIAIQGQLLRVLQEGEIRRVGESFHRKVDVRIVAATHRDLERMVKEQTFRQDLFYRLKVATVRLPPLRERGDDILLLVEYFLGHNRPASEVPRVTESARRRLLSHHWPGNVRELRNVLEVASALVENGEIRAEHLDLPAPADIRGDYHQQVDTFKKQLVGEVLAEAAGNRSAAARRLGMTRQALSYLVRQLGLD